MIKRDYIILYVYIIFLQKLWFLILFDGFCITCQVITLGCWSARHPTSDRAKISSFSGRPCLVQPFKAQVQQIGSIFGSRFSHIPIISHPFPTLLRYPKVGEWKWSQKCQPCEGRKSIQWDPMRSNACCSPGQFFQTQTHCKHFLN